MCHLIEAASIGASSSEFDCDFAQIDRKVVGKMALPERHQLRIGRISDRRTPAKLLPKLRSGGRHIEHHASTRNRSVAVENYAELLHISAHAFSLLDTHLGEPS
jgi:hypothetical protein